MANGAERLDQLRSELWKILDFSWVEVESRRQACGRSCEKGKTLMAPEAKRKVLFILVGGFAIFVGTVFMIILAIVKIEHDSDVCGTEGFAVFHIEKLVAFQNRYFAKFGEYCGEEKPFYWPSSEIPSPWEYSSTCLLYTSPSPRD